MSGLLMGHVLYLDLPHGDKMVLVALADNATDGGFCYPSRETLAVKTSFTERYVTERTRVLAELGWLTMTPSHGPGHSTGYMLNAERIHEEGSRRRKETRDAIRERRNYGASSAGKGELHDIERGNSDAAKGELWRNNGGTPRPPNRKEPSKKHHEEPTAPPPDDLTMVIRHWETIGGTISPMVADRLQGYLDRGASPTLICDAMTHSAERIPRPVIAYVEKVIQGWMTNGRPTSKPKQQPLTPSIPENRVTVPDYIPAYQEAPHVRRPTPTA